MQNISIEQDKVFTSKYTNVPTPHISGLPRVCPLSSWMFFDGFELCKLFINAII